MGGGRFGYGVTKPKAGALRDLGLPRGAEPRGKKASHAYIIPTAYRPVFLEVPVTSVSSEAIT